MINSTAVQGLASVDLNTARLKNSLSNRNTERVGGLAADAQPRQTTEVDILHTALVALINAPATEKNWRISAQGVSSRDDHTRRPSKEER